MDKIVKMINGTIHTSGCTLKCDYCYLAQSNYRNDSETYALRYPLETVLQACSKKRLGGTAFIQIIGDGETLLPKDAVSLICGLLKEGHYVQVVTNGTLQNRIHELVETAEQNGLVSHLLLSFSLHFLELEKHNLLEIESYNFEYIDDLEKMDNHKFCYAGSWYFQVDFTTGMYSQCLMNAGFAHNFFEHLDRELLLEPVGTGCKAAFCWCGWAKKLNLIPNECNYIKTEKFVMKPENQFIDRGILDAGFANLAETNCQYSEKEKAVNKEKRLQYDYFSKKVDLLNFDFKEKNYLKFIEGAEELLQNDLNPRLLYVVQLVVRYGYSLLRSGQWERAMNLESCYDDLNYNADYCLVMGLIYMKNGMVEKAIQMFSEAADKNFVMDKGANSYLPYYNLGVIYECLGEERQAQEYYQKCNSYGLAQERLRDLLGCH